MGINHCSFDIAVAKKLLNCANIVTGFEEVGSEAMPEGMARGMFVDASFADTVFDGFLKAAFTQMPTADDPCFFFFCQGRGGENILPAPFAVYIGVFSG